MKPLSPEEVCAAIVHYGDRERTTAVIAQLQALEPRPGQILIVDNGPDFSDSDWPTASTSRQTNSGFSGGVNQAADYAMGNGYRAVWILNNDVTIATHALGALTQVVAETPEVEVVGSVVTMERGQRVWFGGGTFDQATGRAGHQNHGKRVGETSFTRRAMPTEWINGCSMLIPTQVFATRGHFDEHLFLYKEELEWQIRTGHVRAIIVDDPLLDHEVGATTGSTDGILGRSFMCRNGLILALRCRGLRRARWIAAWVIDYVARPVAKGRFGELGAVLFALRTTRMSGFEALEAMQ